MIHFYKVNPKPGCNFKRFKIKTHKPAGFFHLLLEFKVDIY